MDDKRTIGRRIKERCGQRGISVAALGRAVGYQASTSIWRVVDGRTEAGTEKLIAIAKELGMSFAELTGSDREPELAPETDEEREKIDRYVPPGAPARDRKLILIGLRESRAEKAARDAAPMKSDAPGSSRPPAPTSIRKRKRPGHSA